MDINLINTILSLKDVLNVPLKYVDKDEALNRDSSILNGYISFNESGSEKYATLDEEEFFKHNDVNKLAIKLENMQNLRTIKKCILFFTYLTIIGIGAGLFILIVSLSR